MSAAARYLSRIYDPCVNGGLVEARSVPSGRRCWTAPGDWRSLGTFVSAAVNACEDVYVGLATRKDASRGTADNLLELGCAFVDIDKPPAEVRAALDGFPFPFTTFVASGAGTHVTWQLREPLDVSEPAGVHRAASLYRRLAAYVGGDDRATSPAVTPRLPNTLNRKYAAPLPVVLLEETDSTVDASELEDLLPAEVVDRKRNTMTIESGIRIGSRHSQLFALTRSLQCSGVPFSAIATSIRIVNAEICEVPLLSSELEAMLHDCLVRPHRVGFIVPRPRVLVLHDAPDATLDEDERPAPTATAEPSSQKAVKETTEGPGTADAFVAALVAAYGSGPVTLAGFDTRQRARAAGIPERTLRRALQRAGLQPVRFGRGSTRRVDWQIDKRHEEIA